MMNILFGQAIIMFFIGVLMGNIDAWNKKVMHIIIIIGILLVVITSFYIGIDNIYSPENPWWRTIFGAVFVFIGMKVGEILHNEVFKK